MNKEEAFQWIDAINSGGVPVQWDRVTDDGDVIKAYGWILRHDMGCASCHVRHEKAKDFILLRFEGDAIEFTTSSSRYSAEIARLLCFQNDEHVPCVPYLKYFDGVHVTHEQRTAIRSMQEPKGE